MTTTPTCPSWCSNGASCDGYHWSDAFGPPIATGAVGERVSVRLTQCAAEGLPARVLMMTTGGPDDADIDISPQDVRELVRQLHQAAAELMPSLGPRLASAQNVIEGRARYADTPGGHADRKTLEGERRLCDPNVPGGAA